MKVHIVLSHKLVEMDVLGVKPPLLPLGCKIRGDANITYTGFKLDTVKTCVIMTSWCEPTHTSTKKSLDRVSRLAKGAHRGPFPSCLDQGRHLRRERGHPTLDPE